MSLSQRLFTEKIIAQLGGATILLACTLLVGRVSGIMREFLLAAKLGTSAEADYAVVLLTLPDLLVNLLVAGGLSAVLVPQFRRCDNVERRQLFWRVSGITVVVFGAIAAISILAPQIIFWLLVPGLHAPVERIGALPIAFAALAIPLSALSGVSGSYLNADDRYFVVGLGTVMFNLAIVFALIFVGDGDPGLLLIAAGVFFGALARWVSQLWSMPGNIWLYRGQPSNTIDIPWSAFFAATTAAASTLLVPVIIRAAASATGVGAVASLNYAQKLVELPTGVLFSAMSTVALTRMSRAHVETGGDAAWQQLSNGLQQVLLLALMATVGSVCFAEPIVEIAYGYGAMSAPALNIVAALFGIGAIGLPAIAFNLLVMAYLNATGRPFLVFRATFAALAALLIFILPGVLQGSLNLLVWASVVSQMFLALVLILVVKHTDHLKWRSWLAVVASREWIGRLLVGIIIMLLAVVLNWSFGVEESIISLGIMAAAFAMAVIASHRHRDST